MTVSRKTLQAIKDRPLSEALEALGSPLKRIGREYVTLCPWHDDTNPSLTISDQKGFCFCHCCRNGGDILDYIQKAKGLTLPEAAELAAGILNIPFELDNQDPGEAARKARERKNLINQLEAEQAAFKTNINSPENAKIRQIIKDRGLIPEACREFGIGYSDSGFFCNRITIPIHNHKSELVGFTGRAVSPDQPAKYKNSPDSLLFNKKSLIFNRHRAYENAVEAGCIIFVEGHLDVISMWQAGIKNVVAMQGTAAPEASAIKTLGRNIKNFILCFDGDAGGRKATEQFIGSVGSLAANGDISISVACLPEGQDPDDVIRSGGDLYGYISSAVSWLDWTIDVWVSALDKNNTALLTEVESRLKQLIDSLQSRALRTHYIDKASRLLAKNDKEAKALASQWGLGDSGFSNSEWEPRTPTQIRLAAERRLVRLFVHKDKHRDRLRPMMDELTNPAMIWLWRRLQELEHYSKVDLTPHSVMAIVAVAEPHFMDQLRPIVRPNVHVDDSKGVIAHLEAIIPPGDNLF